ncbi:M20 family metallopeptidase [Erysipelotrichaceae bacterium HCN-30851]
MEKDLEYDRYVEQIMNDLWDIAQFIHKNPELAFKEFKAKEKQCEYLEKNGFKVEKGICGLETAFKAQIGEGKPHIAILSEYDALPELGHACGHNLICSSALGTIVALKKYLENKKYKGTISIVGTPAEESGGGKIVLLKKGAFADVDAVFLMHPTSDKTRLAGECMSSMRLHIEFFGKSAHSGSHPEDGINALSASNLYFVATGLLRQQFKGDMRLSGIITKGGKQTGLVPDYVEVEGSISSFNLTELKKNVKKVENCAIGSALAMGCTVKFDAKEGYQGRIPNKVLSDVCRKEFENLNEPLLDGMPFDYGGEDLGNISRVIPICNPYVTIFPDFKISNHTEQFRDFAISEAGYRCIDVTCKAMGRSIIRLLENPHIIEEAKKELKERLLKE